MLYMRCSVLILLSLFCVFATHAEMIAYRDRPVGSLSNDNPASYYMNAAFDTVQNPDYFSQKGIYKRHAVCGNEFLNLMTILKGRWLR